MPGTVLVLGPQRPIPNLSQVLDARGLDGPVAVVSAGWRHDEAELSALRRDIGREIVHLPLYRWFEEILAQAPTLAAAYRARQDRIKAFKVLVRPRLSAAYGTILRLHAQRIEDEALHEAEVLDAVRVLRELDSRVLDGCDAIRAEAGLGQAPWQHELVAPFHARVEAALRDCGTIAIAGGHVAVLLNRLEFFGLPGLLRQHHAGGGTIVAWSAGAMVLGARIVLFYDDPPEGPSEPEVLDRGIGLLPGRTLFPHARTRLRLDQADRLRLLEARFGTCTGLESGAALAVQDGQWLDLGLPGSAPHLSPSVDPA